MTMRAYNPPEVGEKTMIALEAAIDALDGKLKLIKWLAKGSHEEFEDDIGRAESQIETLQRFLSDTEKTAHATG